MSIGERLRETAYWCLDAVRGGNVKKHYNEIKKCYEQGITDKEVEEKMEKLFSHTVNTCTYYSDLKGKEALNLSDFPIMNKMEYLAHYDEVLSSEYKDKKGNITMTTSGSTGTPFSVIQNRDKANRNTAVSIAWNEIGGFRLGDKRAFLRVWANTNKKSTISKMMENLITLNAESLNDEKLEAVCSLMEQKKVKSLTGYSASLVELSDYIERTKRDLSKIHLNSVFTISEALDEQEKQLLEQQFGCPVNSFYSSQENGNMSMRQKDKGYQLDASTWFIEILKFDSDEPAGEGELGRIVVTDLYNYAFPMIRYENGDAGKLVRERIPGTDRYKIYLSEVYGRRMDMVYDLQGNAISPHNISINMRGIENLVQWKFIQKDRQEYIIQLNCKGEVDTEPIKKRFHSICGDNITFEIVDEIPVLASGKRKPIENRMNKSS